MVPSNYRLTLAPGPHTTAPSHQDQMPPGAARNNGEAVTRMCATSMHHPQPPTRVSSSHVNVHPIRRPHPCQGKTWLLTVTKATSCAHSLRFPPSRGPHPGHSTDLPEPSRPLTTVLEINDRHCIGVPLVLRGRLVMEGGVQVTDPEGPMGKARSWAQGSRWQQVVTPRGRRMDALTHEGH